MNENFIVGALFDCNVVNNTDSDIFYHSLCKQTILGCAILGVLQDMFHFNLTFVVQEQTDVVTEITIYNNESVDIFARPMSLRDDVMELAYPVHNIFDWNFGFTIYRSENYIYYRDFYRKPLSPKLWHCLYGMAVFCTMLFYSLKRWELNLLTGVKHWECSLGYEMLMVVGAFCQHIPPIDAVLYSRRAAYFTFFLFAYLIYTYYTSNLLSHLVNDKDDKINLDTLMEFSMDFLILEDVETIIKDNIAAYQNGNNMSKTLQKLLHLQPVSVLDGLRAMKTKQTAVLSDYITLDPFVHTVFENHEVCSLTNVDVLSNIKKYFFVSKQFPYKEEFKLAFLKIEETGVLSRLMQQYYQPNLECVPLPHAQTPFSQVLYPLCLLLITYLISIVILVVEIVHSKCNRVWPYVE